jgi:hypothetical protein
MHAHRNSYKIIQLGMANKNRTIRHRQVITYGLWIWAGLVEFLAYPGQYLCIVSKLLGLLQIIMSRTAWEMFGVDPPSHERMGLIQLYTILAPKIDEEGEPAIQQQQKSSTASLLQTQPTYSAAERGGICRLEKSDGGIVRACGSQGTKRGV